MNFVLQFLADSVAASFMLFGQCLPYVPQYQSIIKNRSSDGFSLYVSLILILANELRVVFWVGKSFGTILLLQSFVMLITQAIMISVCIRYKTFIKDTSFNEFWNWRSFSPYSNTYTVMTSISIWVFFAALTYAFLNFSIYFEVVGYLSLLTEACLGLPQLISNYKKKNTQGLSNSLIAGWLIGDILKTGYFILNQEPSQFVMCGELQILIDVLIVLQINMYSQNNKPVLSA